MKFSLFYFAAEEEDASGPKYRLLLDGARFADENGFAAVWTPERHFGAFGGLYPSPATAAAAIATITHRVQLRAGSVVLPLNDTIRVAEEWSLIDNLSSGRTGLSFASGWHANDFVFAPERFLNRKEVMFEEIENFRRLWRGEAVTRVNGIGDDVEVRVRPRPVQSEPPLWVTSAGSPDTTEKTGRIGANLLTHLRGQSVAELGELIARYRAGRAAGGHEAQAGEVTLMLHTFVGADPDSVKAVAHPALRKYLGQSLDMARSQDDALKINAGLEAMSGQDRDAMLTHAVERYYEGNGLFGTPLSCTPFVERLRDVGVTEIACLIDFGVPYEAAMEGLEHLNVLRMAVRRRA